MAESAESYVALLRGHIEKEDTILYSPPERVLPEDVRQLMLLAYTLTRKRHQV